LAVVDLGLDVLLGNGDGTFGDPILIKSNTSPPSIAMADLNGDGRPDFVIAGQVADANPRRGTLSIWYNSFPAPVVEAASLPRGAHR
jgi:hypothetical protein